jgi:hypothetical protein
MQQNSDALTGKPSLETNQNRQQSQEGFVAPGLPGQAAGRTPPSSTTMGSRGNATSSETVSATTSQVADKVRSGFDTQKGKAADGLGSMAQALRQSSEQLRQQNQDGAVSGYIATAADQVERLSGYLRSTKTKEIVANVERFARQQPALFVGGAFMLGILGARFLKSSSSASSSEGAGNPRAGGE